MVPHLGLGVVLTDPFPSFVHIADIKLGFGEILVTRRTIPLRRLGIILAYTPA